MSSDTPTVKKRSKTQKKALSPQQVADYLQENPDFFVDRDELLAELSLPHESGKAISLLERQVSILRERSMEARHTLNCLLENAHSNDQLFAATRSLTLTLLRQQGTADIVRVVQDNLLQQENIDACSLIMLSAGTDDREQDSAAKPGLRIEPTDDVRALFPELFRSRQSLCGVFDRERSDFLFPRSGRVIRSAALCPISPGTSGTDVRAVLALGNGSEGYFTRDLDTLFLDFIGELLAALVFQKA